MLTVNKAASGETPVSIGLILAARARISGIAIRTPLIRYTGEGSRTEIYLKLENLQPIGSFKLRGAANSMALAGADVLAGGVYSASAGNMAQGVAWCAREFGVRCRVCRTGDPTKSKDRRD